MKSLKNNYKEYKKKPFVAVWCDKSAGKYSEENGDQMRTAKWIIFGMLVALLVGCSEKKQQKLLRMQKMRKVQMRKIRLIL